MRPLASGYASVGAAVASAIVGAIAGLALSGPYEVAASAFLAATMGAIAFEDVRRLRVPDVWNALAAIGGFVVVALDARFWGSDAFQDLLWAALSMLLCGGAFLLLREIFFRLRGVEGLGFGDVKLAATGGIWLGWELFPIATTVAAIVAIAWVAATLAFSRSWTRERKIPFAAFLAPSIWLCWLYARMGAF